MPHLKHSRSSVQARNKGPLIPFACFWPPSNMDLLSLNKVTFKFNRDQTSISGGLILEEGWWLRTIITSLTMVSGYYDFCEWPL
ncbi:hypothetical protein TNCT_586821 [Trichonephila clavata]|uniref:Uncharacterized protein n=1 Tax=Trichonephila clavata TaxID=2740835 RepID=A0A8X6JB09_TRICU|nr:hypothetical protein TNCT_586821 [Trichonephila clavata]